MAVRVLLADDHILFAETLAELLSDRYEIVDIVADGKALEQSALKYRPDVIVTDITMPSMSGLDAVRFLRKGSFSPKIIFLTMHADAELARECFNAGGSAFVNKESSFDELIAAIEAVLNNHQYLSPAFAAGFIDKTIDPAAILSPSEQLTSRQREILQLLGEGKTMKEIASITNLSTRTVEWHKYKMMRMLAVQNSSELIQQAVRMKLVV